MKKKTALTLSAIALLSAGITFGVRFKQKKDFEKTLKTVLIPNAEKELDSLLREDAALQDSIDLYQALLLQQASEADGQRIAEKHRKLLGEPTPNMYSDLNEVSNTLKLMEKDWEKAYKKVQEQKKPFHLGDGEYDYDAMPKGLEQKEKYLYRMTDKLAENDPDSIPEIPGGYQQYYARGYNDIEFTFDDPVTFDAYTEYLRYEIRATRGQFTTTGGNGNRVFYPITSGEEIKQLLIAIKYFVNNFDNSQGIIHQQYISQINNQINELLPLVEKQIKLEQTRDATASKLDKFKSGKKATEKRVQQQKEKVKVLKTTDIKKLMKQKTK